MMSATIAVLCLADPLTAAEVAELTLAPCAVSSRGSVMAFPTATAAAWTSQRLRTSRPFIRGAIEVGETDVAPDGAYVLDSMAAVQRAATLVAAASPGDVLVS